MQYGQNHLLVNKYDLFNSWLDVSINCYFMFVLLLEPKDFVKTSWSHMIIWKRRVRCTFLLPFSINREDYLVVKLFVMNCLKYLSFAMSCGSYHMMSEMISLPFGKGASRAYWYIVANAILLRYLVACLLNYIRNRYNRNRNKWKKNELA